jgi:acetyl esterase/lipase
MKRTTAAFHPDLRRIARCLPRSTVNRWTLPLMKGLDRKLSHRPAAGVVVERVGEVTIRFHGQSSSDEPRPALLWIHGGGFVLGSAAQDDAVCRHFAEQLDIIVAAVDYRQAPEEPFPAPLEDCYEALAWLARQPSVDPSRIAVGGASAGGGLAAGLALLAHDRGELPVAFQLLSYPMLDDRTVLREDLDERGFRFWNNKANRFGWTAYLGREPGAEGISDHAAPARRAELAGLPPAWIGVGDLDLFHDEDLAFAERLRAAGVEVQLDVIDGAFHGFDSVAPKAGVTLVYRSIQVEALAGALGRPLP